MQTQDITGHDTRAGTHTKPHSDTARRKLEHELRNTVRSFLAKTEDVKAAHSIVNQIAIELDLIEEKPQPKAKAKAKVKAKSQPVVSAKAVEASLTPFERELFEAIAHTEQTEDEKAVEYARQRTMSTEPSAQAVSAAVESRKAAYAQIFTLKVAGEAIGAITYNRLRTLAATSRVDANVLQRVLDYATPQDMTKRIDEYMRADVLETIVAEEKAKIAA